MGKPGRPTSGLDDYLYWQQLFSDRKASGLSVDELCADAGVSRSSFYRWMDRLKAGIPDAVKDQESLKLPKEVDAKFLPVSVTASPIEIELPNGGFVRLPVGVGQAVIVQVVEAVSAARSGRRPS